MKATAALGVLILLLLAPSAISQVPDDKLIVPGQRIGKWTLEMTIDRLVQMNGRRNSQGPVPARDLVRNFTLHCWGRTNEFCAVTQDGQKVEWLTGQDAEFKTEKGVSIHVPRAQVEAAYGRPAAVTEHTVGAQRLIWDEIGLAVSSAEPAAIVERVYVFRPGTAKTLWKF